MKTCWITVNRSCNLRCKWCYAFDTGFSKYDNLDFENAKKIVDFCAEMHIQRIILIGGEPTIYPHIFDLIKYISDSGIKIALVTNGLALADKKNAEKFMNLGVTTFSVSVKANSKEEYKELTGKDCFDNLLLAIKNLSDLNASFSVSQVLTYNNIPTFANGIDIFKRNGAKVFSFSFCYNFNCGDTKITNISIENNPYVLAELFKRYYKDIDSSLAGCKYALSQELPLCVWDMNLIEKLKEKNSITSICQLMGGGGILFDTDLSLIPCNAMYKIKYGKFLEDFCDKESFDKFYQSKPVQELFLKLRGIPDKKCLTCNYAVNCGGGCVTNWTNYSFNELETSLKNDYIKWREKNG